MNPYPAVLSIRAWDFSRWVNAAGLAGLFICGFGMLFKKPVANFGFALMAIGFALEFKGLGRAEKRDPLLLSSIAFLLFLAVRGGLAASDYPDQKNLIFEGALKLAGAAGLVAYLFAFWMHRARGKWAELLMVIMAGYLVQVLRQIEWGHLTDFIYRLWSGAQRATFGFSTNRFGLFSAVILLACLVLYRRVWGPQDKPTRYYARIVFWGVVCFLSAMGLFFSQSRSAWVAAILFIPAALAFKVFALRGSIVRWLMPILLVAVMIGVALYLSNVTKILEQRLAPGIDAASVSNRLGLYEIAWENWKKHPFVGRGPGTSRVMILQAGEKYNDLMRLDHLHNVLFDTAAQVGIVGIAFIGLSAFLIIQQAFRCKYAETSDKGYVHFALGAIVMMLVTGIVNQPFHSPHGVYLVGYLGGICYSFKFVDESSKRLSLST